MRTVNRSGGHRRQTRESPPRRGGCFPSGVDSREADAPHPPPGRRCPSCSDRDTRRSSKWRAARCRPVCRQITTLELAPPCPRLPVPGEAACPAQRRPPVGRRHLTSIKCLRAHDALGAWPVLVEDGAWHHSPALSSPISPVHTRPCSAAQPTVAPHALIPGKTNFPPSRKIRLKCLDKLT